MSTYGNIAAGLKTVIEAGTTGFPSKQVYATPIRRPNSFPAFIIIPTAFDPRVALQGNTFQGEMRIVVLVCSVDDVSGFGDLYDIMDPTEATKSLIAAIRADRTLNGKADSSEIDRWENIGMREVFGGFFYGADAIVEFIKSVS